jgi:dihydrolipoamide dehydrogenase
LETTIAMKRFDTIVIGGGPGGYAAAVRSSQLGMKTALVEKESLGGTCLNWGCIPTKSLLRNAEVINLLSKGRTYGFSFENLSVDFAAAHKRSRQVAKRQARRLDVLMESHDIEVITGTARFVNSTEVALEPSDERLSADQFIIATGAKARSLPGVEFDGQRAINFRRALDMTGVPESALIVGAGPIGMEFATIWNRYGTKVAVVEMMPRALPLEDEDISLEAEKQFKRNRISIKTSARVQALTVGEGGVVVSIAGPDEASEEITVQTVLVAIGFAPNLEGLGLDQAGVIAEPGGIVVDEQMRTSVPHIFAVGDVNGKMGLAHVASAQAMIAAEAIAGLPTEPINYANIPRCTYAAPEIASVGLTEAQAREQGYEVATAWCPFVGNGKALAMDDNTGFAKIVADVLTKKILGVHLVGGHVTELVAGAAGMLTLESTFEDLGRIVHPHPSLSEAVMEAAHSLCGHSIHI